MSIYEQAISHFGAHKQIIKAVEELNELSVQLCKLSNGLACNVDTEIADVEIMLEQVKLIMDNRKDVENCKIKKLDRLGKLMDCAEMKFNDKLLINKDKLSIESEANECV